MRFMCFISVREPKPFANNFCITIVIRIIMLLFKIIFSVSSYRKGRCYTNIGNSGKFRIAYSDCSTEIDELEKGPFYDDFLNNPSDEKLVKLCGYVHFELLFVLELSSSLNLTRLCCTDC